MSPENRPRPSRVFLSYAEEDQAFRDDLEKHLIVLQRLGLIDDWHRREITPGEDWQKAMVERLDQADIILLFITPDYLNSDWCYDVQMPQALKKHAAGEARVIPLYLRPVALYDPGLDLPFTRLQRLPKDGDQAVSQIKKKNRDSTLAEMVADIKRAIEDFAATSYGQRTSSPTPPAPPPHLWSIPYKRNPFFTGRDALIQTLHATFASRQEQGITTLALSGLGGSGKTQVALAYAYRYCDDYHAIFWLQGQNTEVLRADFIGLAKLLHLSEYQDPDPENTIAALKRYLSQAARWLIIIDHLESFAALDDLFPSLGQGNILATTRRHAAGESAIMHRVQMLTPAEGALFLLRRIGKLDQHASMETLPTTTVDPAHTISQLLSGLPLALDQAGAYIEQTACSLATYIERYTKHQAELLKLRGKSSASHPASVAATFALCIEQARQLYPVSLELLSLCAFLHPDAIPLEIFNTDGVDLGPELQPLLADELAFDRVLAMLLDLSLLQRNADNEALSIHRLVQVVIRDEMPAETQRIWTERAISAVYRVFPASEMRYWPQCQRYLPHALLVADLIQQYHLSLPEAARLLYFTACYLYDMARYLEASKYCEQALTIVKQVYGKEHAETAHTLHCLANIYESWNQADRALDLYQQALAIAEHTWGAEQAEMARLLHDLGEHFQGAEQFARAEECYQRAFAIREQLFGLTHPETASSLNNLAGLSEEQGHYEQAAEWYEQALQIRLHLCGPHHVETAESLSNLARFYRVVGKYQQAEPLYEQAIAAYQQALGPQHPRVATCYNNFAVFCITLGRYAQAEQWLTQALDIRTQLFGLQDPRTAASWNHLGRVYFKQGRHEQAQALYQQALTICKKRLGSHHSTTRSILLNMSELSLAQGDSQQAERLLTEILTALTTEQESRPIGSAPVLNLLGEVYLARGQYEQAEHALTEALAIRQEKQGKTHPEKAMSLKSLGDLALARNENAQATEWYQQALELVVEPLGPSHPDVIALGERLISLLQQMGRAEEAQTLAQRIRTPPAF